MFLVVTVLAAIPAAASENRSSGAATASVVPVPIASWAAERPVVSPGLKILFASNAAVHGLDLYSTALARTNGARETNPIMDGGIVRMVGIKAAAGVATYFAVRRMAKQHRKAAIVTMFVLNGVTAAVAVRNLKNAGQSS
jgi:hypothetical protein